MKILLCPTASTPASLMPADADAAVWPAQVAEDSGLLPSGKRRKTVLTVGNTLGDLRSVWEEAYVLAGEITAREPLFLGTPLLWHLEDYLADLLQRGVAQERFFARLRPGLNGGDPVIAADGARESMGVLINRLQQAGCSVVFVARGVPSNGKGGRTIRRLGRLRSDLGAGPRQFTASLLERLDRSFRVRPRIGRHVFPRSPGRFRPERTLAFSSTEVFTRTIVSHLDRLGDVCFVVAGQAAAGPLRERGIPFAYWWEFASGLAFPETEIRLHVERLISLMPDTRGGRLLGELGVLGDLERMHLPFVVRLALILKSMMDKTRPERVVVANQGSAHEAAVLRESSARGVRSIQLQHGVFGDDYLDFQDVRSDELWVRGEFWRDSLPEKSRARAVIQPRSGDRAREERRPAAAGTDIVYLTAPPDDSPFKSLAETREILQRVAACARRLGRRLLVRVHPRERCDCYAAWLGGRSSPHHLIQQGGSVDGTLERARIVVTYCSTIFMECLRQGIPIVSFEWHPFRFGEGIHRERVFHFARTLGHLEELLEEIDADPGRHGDALSGKYRLFVGGS